MAINGLNAAYSGMYDNAVRLGVSANNVANVNTDGFTPSRVVSTDTASINGVGQGVRTAGTYSPPSPQPPPVVVQGMELQADSGQGYPTGQSGTDLIAEMTGQIAARDAYGVNVGAARTADEMSRTVIDLVA